MSVLDTIQKKFHISTVREYPNSLALSYLFNNVPAGSRILALAVKMFSNVSFRKMDRKLEALANMLGAFLALCLIAAGKRSKARECKSCNPGKGWQNHSGSHCKEDLLHLSHLHPCTFHEHGEDLQEEEQCKAGWNAWLTELVKSKQARTDENSVL